MNREGAKALAAQKQVCVRYPRRANHDSATPSVLGAKCVDATERVGVVLQGRRARIRKVPSIRLQVLYSGLPPVQRGNTKTTTVGLLDNVATLCALVVKYHVSKTIMRQTGLVSSDNTLQKAHQSMMSYKPLIVAYGHDK